MAIPKIQYASDLHLEFYESADFPAILTPSAHILVLAGDIGNPNNSLYTQFLEYVSNNWTHIIYVTGNHEYYSEEPVPIETTHAIIKSVVGNYRNIHLLDSEHPSYCIDGIVFIGNTLWSDVSSLSFVPLNDYKRIKLTPKESTEFHKSQKANLKAEINYWTIKQACICVVTHHMPSYVLIHPKYASDPLNCAFASCCEDLLTPCVKAWIYGHTHDAAKRILRSTLMAVNARGYPDEQVPGYCNTACLELCDVTPSETEEFEFL